MRSWHRADLEVGWVGVCERVGDLEMVEAVAFGQNITDFDYLVMMNSRGMVARRQVGQSE